METAIVLGVIDFVLCAAVGLVVLFSAPGRATNRVLAGFLFAEGTLMLAAGASVLDPGASPERAGAAGVFVLALGALPPLTLAVLRELPTPLVRPLRGRVAGIALALSGLALISWNLTDIPYPRENATTQWAYYALFATNLVSILACLDAWRRAARGSHARRQARLFLFAFGARDVAVVVFFVTATGQEHGLYVLGAPLIFYGTLFLVPLLAYAILRTQVLGIELVVKAGLRRALMVGAFVVVFFLASETAERMFAARYGQVAGFLAAGALALVSGPLHRLVERMTDAAMPGVEESAAYREARRIELYRAAIESAHESGGISDKERESLARLREKLGVAAHEAAAIERDVVSAAA